MTLQVGQWVRVEFQLLAPAERAAMLPQETAETPYMMFATGVLDHEAEIGDVVTITTQTGRTVTGTLREENPGFWHTYGAVHPAFRDVTQYISQLQRSLSS